MTGGKKLSKYSRKRKALITSVMIVTMLVSLANYPLNYLFPSDPTAIRSVTTDVSGEVRITVIPVAFADVNSTMPIENISRTVFGYINEYFQNQSYGKIWLTGSVLDWLTVPNNVSHYDNGSLSYDPTGDVADAAQLLVDHTMSQIIWTEENYTEHAVLLYSGPSSVHPHHKLDYYIKVGDDRKKLELSLAPELYGYATIAHEIAHGFGLRDLYSKLYGERFAEFVGDFSLMDNAGYVNINDMCGYSRYRLGWIDPEQVEDINQDSTMNIDSLESDIGNTKLLRIQLDAFRFYLVESRIDQGILISLVDCTREESGYGRVEAVRSFNALNEYNCNDGLFKVGETYLDPYYMISIDVLQDFSNGHQVRVMFELEDPSVGVLQTEDSNLLSCSSTYLENGTSIIAFSFENSSSGSRFIELYRWFGSFDLIHRTSKDNDSFNPVLIGSENEFLMFYEMKTLYRTSIVVFQNYSQYIVSESDDAMNLSVDFDYNAIYLAYERQTTGVQDIVVRTATTYTWRSQLQFSIYGAFLVGPNCNGTPMDPSIINANNEIYLSYIRKSDNNSQIEFTKRYVEHPILYYDVDSSIMNLHVIKWWSFDLYVTIEYENRGSIFFFETYPNEVMTKIKDYNGEYLLSFAMMGAWLSAVQDGELVVDRVRNSFSDQGEMFRVDLEDRIVDCVILNYNGSPVLISFSSNSLIANAILVLPSLSLNQEQPILMRWIGLTGIVTTSVVLSILIISRIDIRVNTIMRKWKNGRKETNKMETN